MEQFFTDYLKVPLILISFAIAIMIGAKIGYFLGKQIAKRIFNDSYRHISWR
jgi:membrane protein DedA with SNARE-associated domain